MANRLILAGFGLARTLGQQGNRPVIRIFDDAGHALASIKTWPDLYYPTALAGDRSGNLYVALYSDATQTALIRKFNRDGYSLATPLHHNGARVNQIHVDSSGNVFLTGAPVNAAGHLWDYGGGDRWPRTGYVTTRKHDSSGNPLWTLDNGIGSGSPLSAAFCVDGNGDVLITLGDTSGVNKGIRKYNGATGALLWEATYPWDSYPWSFAAIATDSTNAVYALGRAQNDQERAYLYKLSSSGTLLATSAKLTGINGATYCRFDAGNVLHLLSAYHTTVDTTLTQLAAVDLPDYSGAVGPGTVDTDGAVYIGYPAPSGFVSISTTYYQLMRVNPTTGAMVWGFENFEPWPKTLDGWWEGCTCVSVIESPDFPALPLPLALGIPTTVGDRYTLVSGLPLPLALGIPTVIRDYVGTLPLQQVFRLRLSGGTGTIELPLSSFTCRRGLDYLSVSIVCPGLSSAQLTQIEARLSGTLSILTGPRFSDGLEQLDPILSVPMGTLRWDQGARSASATLDGRLDNPPSHPKTRVLRGISYRNIHDGRRRVRCVLDTYLAPGDTADLGAGETLLVGDITYSVSKDSAVMEIAESS
jgi:hypothetical protein